MNLTVLSADTRVHSPLDHSCCTNFLACAYQLWQKVVAAVVWIFTTLFCCCRKAPDPLTEKDIEVLNDMKKAHSFSQPTPGHRRRHSVHLWQSSVDADAEPLSDKPVNRRLQFEEEVKVDKGSNSRFAPSLPTPDEVITTTEEVRSVAKQVAFTVDQYLFEKHIKKPLEFFKDSLVGKASKLEAAITFVIELIGNNAKTISQSMQRQTQEGLDPGLQSFLRWLFGSLIEESDDKFSKKITPPQIDEQTLSKFLVEACESRLEPRVFKSAKDFATKIAPLVTALHQFAYETDGKQLEINRILRDNEDILSTVLSSLIHNKIRTFCEEDAYEVFEQIPLIAETLLFVNSQKISTALADNYIKVVTNIDPFKEFLDGAIEQVCEHLELVVKTIQETSATTNAMETRYLSNKGKNLKTEEERKRQQVLEEHFVHGKDWVFQQLAVINFVKDPICHPYLRKCHAVHKQVTIDTLCNTLRAENFFHLISKVIVDIFLPLKGSETSTSTTQLLSNLEGSKELSNLFKTAKDLIWKAIVSAPRFAKIIENTQTTWKGIFEHLYTMSKPAILEFFANKIRDNVQSALEPLIEKLFRDMINPERLRELLATSVIPNIKTLTFQSFAKTCLERSLRLEKTLPTLFQQLLANKEGRADCKKQISTFWWSLITKECHHFSLEATGTTEQEFTKEIALPQIEEMSKFVIEYCSKTDPEALVNDVVTLTPEKIIAVLGKFLGSETTSTFTAAEHQLYARLFQRALFDLGDYKSFGGWVQSGLTVIQTTITTAMLHGVSNLRADHDDITQLLCNVVRRHFGTLPALTSHIEGEQKIASAEEVNTLLNKEIDDLANLTYDYVLCTVKESNFAISKAVKVAFGSTSTALANSMKTVVNKTTQHVIFTSDFLLKITDVCRTTLQAGLGDSA